MQNNTNETHTINITNRGLCKINGIKKIESITENKIVLKTEKDYLCLFGQNLEVLTINTDKEELEIKGIIDAINYQLDKETEIKKPIKKESFLIKLFK
jgi:sporulation protein YabP